MRLFACLIVAPQRGYDEPAILSYAISSFCPTSADGLHFGPYRLPGWLSGTARSSTRPTRTLGLDWRARNRAVGTEHATVARLRPQRRPAADAAIENPAGISRHGLRFRGGAMRTGDDRFKDHGSS